MPLNADIADLKTLFADKPVSYRIPYFQRPYAWKINEQWEPLLRDVLKLSTFYMEQDDSSKVRPHFLGAIVLQSYGNSSSSEVDKRLVVDGQQRLTTLQLLIRAAQAAFQSLNDLEKVDQLKKLTLNNESYWAGDSHNQMKIRQSNLNDQSAFQDAIRNNLGDESNHSRSINHAYGYFRKEISEWLNADAVQREARSKALIKTLSKHLQIAAIDLDPKDKPHIIFETLNARGERLLQSDLVKNTVMYEADVVDDADMADRLWGMFEDPWWRRNTRESRLDRVHLDRLLNYWVVMRSRRQVAADRVASAFRDHIGNNPDVFAIAEDIKNAGIYYKDIEEGRIPGGRSAVSGIETFIERIKALEIGVVMWPLLWLYTSDRVTDEHLTTCVNALESFLVRRMLCGIQTQGLNDVFIELVGKLHSNETSQPDRIVVSHLAEQTVDNRIWPSDRQVESALVDDPMKGSIKRRIMALKAIEIEMESDKTETISLDNLTLEHLMPQSWNRYWPLPEGSSEEDRENRDRAVKSIGNLTLITGKLNSSISNGPWGEKRKALDQHSVLMLSKEPVKEHEWNEERIEARARQLAQIAIKVWPHADSF